MEKAQVIAKEKIVIESKDIDQSAASANRTTAKMIENVNEKQNFNLMKAIQENETYLEFFETFLKVCVQWGIENNLEFWEVGINDKESFLTADGRHIVLTPCRTTKNPNPKTGERQTESGIVLPAGVNA